jgi:hypothetical protein
MRNSLILLLIATVCAVSCKNTQKSEPQVEGHYTYQHGWNYDIDEGNIDVLETGTMDFYKDSTALDSARQVYKVTFNDGSKATWVFNYVSPSLWHVEGEDFYFAGVEETFRMELVENTCDGCDEEKSKELAQKTVEGVSGGIAREIKFHLASLTEKELVWSYTYSDGHTDTWEFYRE